MKITDVLFKIATRGCKSCPYKEWCFRNGAFRNADEDERVKRRIL